MKRCFGHWDLVIGICLIIGIWSLGFWVSGCGQQGGTTPATTTTADATQVNAAKAGVLLASGSSSVGNSSSGAGSAAGVRILSVRTLSGPPASFFTNLLTGSASIDGYLTPTNETIAGSMAPYMRFKTAGGSVVNGAFLSGKKIAKWLTLEVETMMMNASEGNMPPGMTAEVTSYLTRYITAYISGGNVHPFSSTTLFQSVRSQGEYLAWMFMYPSIEAQVSQRAQMIPGAPSRIYMTTPEATASDKIGGMEIKMVFSRTLTGEVTMVISTESNGRPIARTYSGASTLSTPVGSMETTLSMNFSSDGPPTSLRMVGTMETTPRYTVIVNMSPLTMTATGEVRDSSGTVVGTLEGGPAGGRFYGSGTSEGFSF